MHASAAGSAVVTATMRFPAVMLWDPGLLALLHQVLFMLLCLLALVPGCLAVYVVPLVCVDLLQPVYCVLVDLEVVLIYCFLPFCALSVMHGIGSLPCSQGCIALSPSELGFVPRCIRCSGVFADVKDGDATAVLWGEVLLGTGVAGWDDARLLRECGQLDNDLDRCGGVLGESNQTGLWPWFALSWGWQ